MGEAPTPTGRWRQPPPPGCRLRCGRALMFDPTCTPLLEVRRGPAEVQQQL